MKSDSRSGGWTPNGPTPRSSTPAPGGPGMEQMPPVVTSGGRVLTVVGAGDTVEVARERAYQRVETIGFEGAFWRTDIGAAPTGELAQ